MTQTRDGEGRDKNTGRLLKTDRLICEPLCAAHASLLFDEFRNATLYKYIPQDPPTDVESLEARYRRLAAEPRSADGSELWLNWAMRERDAASFVGTLEATVMPDQSAFIAYFVFESCQRRGFAREGVAALLDHLFDDHGVSVVVAEIDTRNVASIALVTALGFERAAHTVGADHFKGASSDEYRYELRRGRRDHDAGWSE